MPRVTLVVVSFFPQIANHVTSPGNQHLTDRDVASEASDDVIPPSLDAYPDHVGKANGRKSLHKSREANTPGRHRTSSSGDVSEDSDDAEENTVIPPTRTPHKRQDSPKEADRNGKAQKAAHSKEELSVDRRRSRSGRTEDEDCIPPTCVTLASDRKILHKDERPAGRRKRSDSGRGEEGRVMELKKAVPPIKPTSPGHPGTDTVALRLTPRKSALAQKLVGLSAKQEESTSPAKKASGAKCLPEAQVFPQQSSKFFLPLLKSIEVILVVVCCPCLAKLRTQTREILSTLKKRF